jgi:hypothetical protein
MNKRLLTTLLALSLSVTLMFSSTSFKVLAQDGGEGGSAGFGNTPDQRLEKETLDALNPIKQFGEDEEFNAALEANPAGALMSRVLVFAFPIAGLILFVMLVWAGFEMLAGAATKKSLDAGRQRATAAIIGFILLFISYWLVKILEAAFGVRIIS